VVLKTLRSWLFWVLIVFALCSCGTRIHLYTRDDFLQKVNLIENSGFEIIDELGSELPNGWVLIDHHPNQVLIDSQVSHSGERSLKIKKPLASINLTSDSFKVDPTCSYYSRCYIRANKNTQKPVVLFFITFDEGSKRINRFAKRVYPSQDWTLVEITTDNLDLNSAFGRVVLSIPQESDLDFWIDDVESYTICGDDTTLLSDPPSE
jgi:hypothetical protein